MTEVEKIKFLETAVLSLFNKTIQLKSTDHLGDLGLDSLDAVELQLYCEDNLKIELPPTAVINTVKDLLSYM